MYGPVVIWGEVEADIIAQVQQAAELQGLRFGNVHQHLRSNGIECLPGSLDQLTVIANDCVRHVQRRHCAFPMAAFWLCGALLAADETADPSAISPPDGEADPQPDEELSEAALADRVGRELIDWQTIMSALPPTYRATLLDTALQCAAEIRAEATFSGEAFKNAALELDPRRVTVDGYPNGKAPYKHVRRTLLAALARNTEIPFYVMALWAFASGDVIADMSQVARDRGLHFGTLTERYLPEGIYRLPDQVPVLAAIAEERSCQAVGLRVYDYQLAAHWLSAAQLTDAEWAAQQTQGQSATNTPAAVDQAAEDQITSDSVPSNQITPDRATALAMNAAESTAPDCSINPIEPLTDAATQSPKPTDSPDAGGRLLMPWSSILDNLGPKDCDLIADDVLGHSRDIRRNVVEANRPLKTFASIFHRNSFPVDGYTLGLAPYKDLREQVASDILTKPYLSYILLSLWVDANHDSLVELAQIAEAQGWHFGVVGQRISPNGVYLRPDRISDFEHIVANLIPSAQNEQRAVTYILGSFWLLGTELSDAEWAGYSPPPTLPLARRFGVGPSAADWLINTVAAESTPATSVADAPFTDSTESLDGSIEPLDEPLEPPDANGRTLMPWSVITEVMPVDYQEKVIDIALQQSRAVRNGIATMSYGVLQEFADLLDRRKIAIKGYPPGKAPYKVVRRHWLTLITDFPELNLAIIGLWASATHPVITALKCAAEAQGCHFGPIGRRICEDGIYGWAEQITQLGEIAVQLSKAYSNEDQLHYKLATFWLMAAQLTDEEWTARQAAAAEPSTVELAAIVQSLEPGIAPTSEADPAPGVDTPADDTPQEAAPPDQPAVLIGPPADPIEPAAKPIGDRILITWQAFFNALPPIYLETVIDTALRHVNHVHDEPYVHLAASLKQIVAEKVQPNPAPRASVRNFLLKSADEIPESLYIMLLLWSDAARNVVTQVERAARKRGLHLDTTLAYFETTGIYCLPHTLETLTAIADECVRRSGASIYPFRLAAFLLCAAQLTDDEWAARADLASGADDPDSVEATDDITVETVAPPDRPDEPIKPLAATARTIMPWVDVLNSLSREDRRAMIDVALQQSQAIRSGAIRAENDTLKDLADGLTWEHISIEGYRPGQAPLKAVRHYTHAFLVEKPLFTFTVMGLWANARTDILTELQHAAEAQGWHFGSVEKQLGLDGLYLRPDQLPRLMDIAAQVSRHHPSEHAPHFRLAAIWLCSLQLTDEEWTTRQTAAAQLAASTEPPTKDAIAMTDTPVSTEPVTAPPDTTTPRILRDWATFLRNITDEGFRETVVDIALRQVNRVMTEPYLSAAEIVKNLELKGFRAGKVPHEVALQHFLRLVNDSPAVAEAVINLWADASQSLITDFRRAAEARGIRLQAGWPNQRFVTGYYNDAAIQPLFDAAREYSRDLPTLKAYQIYIAACWFSAAQLFDEVPPVTTELNTTPPATGELPPSDEATSEIVPDEAAASSSPPPADEAPVTAAIESVNTAPRTPTRAEIQAAIPANIAPTDDLPTVRQQLQSDLRALDKMRQSIQPDLRAINNAVETSNLPYAEERLDAVRDRVMAWRVAFETLLKDTSPLVDRLLRELDARPGLGDRFPTRFSDKDQQPQYAQIKGIATEFIETIDHMLDYDRAREAALRDLAQHRAQWADRVARLAGWDSGEAVTAPPEIDVEDVSLVDLEEAVTQFNAACTQLAERLKQLRTEREVQLAALIQQLRAVDLDADTVVADGHTLDELTNTRLTDLTDEVLIALEAAVTTNLDVLLTQARQNEAFALTARWRETSDDALLIKLLGRLVRYQREVDAALLIFSLHAAQPAAGLRSLSAPIVRGLVNGLLQLSASSQPFDLLSALAPEFHSGWLPADGRAQAAWYLGLLGAHYGSRLKLPADLWWLLPAPDWPFDDMPRWRALWQAARTGQPLPAILPLDILRTQTAARTERLNRARAQVEQLFIRENGWLPRLRTIRSKRHVKAFNQNLSPILVKQLMVLRQAEVGLDKPLRGDRGAALVRLDQQHHEFSDGTTDVQLEGEYEKVVEFFRLDDSDPVQRRATLKVWQDCVYALIEYGEALIAYWRGEAARIIDLTQEQLEAELAPHPELMALGQVVLQRLTTVAPTLITRDEATALIEQQIVSAVFSMEEVAARLPRTIGLLARKDFAWAALLEPLLIDLAEPLSVEDMAWWWLDRDVPDPVLLLAAHLPIEVQKRAQSLRTDLERSVTELQADVIKLGGDVVDLAEARTLGRWVYVRDRLQQRLTDLQASATVERQRRTEQALTLRRWINELDEAVFQIQDTFPEEVFAIIEHGLTLARRAANVAALNDAARTFLQEIDYRLKHQAWPTASKLQEAVDQLERGLSGAQPAPKAALAAEDVLRLLEQENLSALGAFAHQLSLSEMGTRADLLRNWLRVRGLPSFLSDELAQADRQAIQAVFRYFARLMSLKRVHSSATGAPLEFDDPTVYAYYELRYPKTDALRDHCVLVSLPGSPPRSGDVAHLQNLIDDKGWLDDAFVLVFAPGCTPALAKRLAARRLVIVNEAALLEWVLAERKYSNPLSRLRPRLLNAIGAANVEIFKINQLVNSRTGIFVGRDRDVERVASSDANFAIYGGRRIGKSSLLKSIDDHLREHKVRTAWLSVEGQADLSDNASAARLARQVLGADHPVRGIDDLKPALQTFMDNQPDLNLVIFIDEIDKYIVHNPDRHVLIEALRSLSNMYPGRFRTIVAGFTDLYDCLKGRGPYTPTSDPWRRMFNDLGGSLGNLLPENAEKIVGEGFAEILGWDFEKRAVPQSIVERTGSHPAFIQKFCLDLQRRVAQRGDGLVRLEDIDAVFGNDHPEHSFIAYVRDTLRDNLDPIGRYLSVWLAREAHHQRGFTWDEAREITSLLRVDVNEDLLDRSLERLKVTSVVRERAARVYEFSVPDYPLILTRLGETLVSFDQLEREIAELVEGAHGYRR